MGDADAIAALKRGESLPGAKIIELRSKGMHDVRFEVLHRLLRTGVSLNTLSLYWDAGTEFHKSPVVENVDRKLIIRHDGIVTGRFSDLWLLCYADDAEIRQLAQEEISRMIAAVQSPRPACG